MIFLPRTIAACGGGAHRDDGRTSIAKRCVLFFGRRQRRNGGRHQEPCDENQCNHADHCPRFFCRHCGIAEYLLQLGFVLGLPCVGRGVGMTTRHNDGGSNVGSGHGSIDEANWSTQIGGANAPTFRCRPLRCKWGGLQPLQGTCRAEGWCFASVLQRIFFARFLLVSRGAKAIRFVGSRNGRGLVR